MCVPEATSHISQCKARSLARAALSKSRQAEAEAKRAIRDTGKDKATVAGVEQSQRTVIRELTQRAAALGRDKAELVDERDKLRERLRALKAWPSPFQCFT